jgi:signal transduction histidine kinase
MRVFLIHILSWAAFTGYLILATYDHYRINYEPSFIVFKQVLTIVFLIIPFYINYLLLIPHTLIKRKKYGLFFCGAVILISMDLLLSIGRGLIIDWYLVTSDYSDQITFSTLIKSLSTPILFLGVSSGLRLSKEYYTNIRRQLELESQIIEAELKMLKSQIDPHFLFNSLNNIYGLTQKKSDQAPDAVIKLSEMMRYILHEANQERVSLANEIALLNNFIFLQKLRMVNPDNVNLFLDYEGDQTIAPLLLIPLLENAFKHSDLTNRNIPISVSIEVNGSTLKMEVVNEISEIEKHENSGIGLKNLKRRLDLLYENKYDLKLNSVDCKYIAKLKIDLG